MNNCSVIVLGSNPATRLSLIRCVGAVEGCRVTIINMVSDIPEKPYRTIDTYSKYVDKYFFAKKFDADGLARLLMEKCRVEGEKPFLMSVDDDSACLIDTIQDQIRNDFYFSHIGNKAGAIAELMDKAKQKQLAKEFGFKVAESWSVDCVDGKYEIPQGVKYPCYIKGRLSYHSAKLHQKKCSSEQELAEWLKVIAKENPSPMIIEEFIEINKEYGIIGYSDSEKVILPGIVELLDGGHGSHKGVSAFGRVNDFSSNEPLKQQIERFIKYIRLTGLFNVDFVEAYGKLYFVELNMRFAAYGYAVCKAGANLPAFHIYKCLSEDEGVLSTRVKNGFCYVNEKVAFDDVEHGYRSMSNYRRLIKNADCCMIRQEDDSEPYKMFRKNLPMDLLKTRIKRIIHLTKRS